MRVVQLVILIKEIAGYLNVNVNKTNLKKLIETALVILFPVIIPSNTNT